jgi:hypothetical protein
LKLISTTHIDRLAGALLLDGVLRSTFLADRSGAIENFNNSYALRFGEKPIELTDDEMSLVLSIPATSIEQFYEMLDLALNAQFTRQAPANGWSQSKRAESSAA